MRRGPLPLLCAVVVLTAAGLVGWLAADDDAGQGGVDTTPTGADDDSRLAAGGEQRETPRSARVGAAISGGVRNDDDTPAADVTVECVPLAEEPADGASAPVASFSAPARIAEPAWIGATSPKGTFRSSPLAPGSWRVVARSPDGRLAVVTARVAARQGADVHLRLPPHGFVLRGRVENADGSAARARVAVQSVTQRGFSPEEFASLASTPTGADGSFVVAGISAHLVNAIVTCGDEVTSVGRVAMPRETPLVIRLGAGVTRRAGLVRDAATKLPIAGARLAWYAWTHDERLTVGSAATSEAEGRFDLPGLERGRLTAEAAGYGTEQLWDDGGKAEIVVELRRHRAITGRVVTAADGAPVEGAVVWAITGAMGRRLERGGSAVSGADGAFTLPVAPMPRTFVFVHGGGWTSRGLATANIDGANPFFVAPGSDEPLVLAAEPSGRIEGRVVLPDGAPAPGARVTAWTSEYWTRDRPVPLPETVSALDGRFAFDGLVPGVDYSVGASADGWAPVLDKRVADRVPRPELVLRLADAWTAIVRVVAAEDGRPVAGATVDATVKNESSSRGFRGLVTNRDGCVTVGPSPRGDVWVSVQADDRVRCDEADRVVLSGTDPPRGDVVLAKGRSIEGRVELPAATSAGRVVVSVLDVRSNRSAGESTTAGPDFRVDRLAEGLHVVSARMFDAEGRRWEGSVRADAGATGLVIALIEVPDLGRIALHDLVLRVSGEHGEFIASAAVTAVCRRARTPYSAGATFTNGSATFRIRESTDAIEFVVRSPRDAQGRPLPFGSVRVQMPDPGAAEFEVRLPPARTIEGRVTDDAGNGVAGALVGAAFVDGAEPPRDTPRSASSTWTDTDGRFRLDGLGDEDYWLGVAVPAPWRPVATVKVRGGAADVAFVVAERTLVRVTVRDAAGAPIAGAVLDARFPRSSSRAWTDADGIARFADLPRGDIAALHVELPEGQRELLPVVLSSWTIADTEVVMSPGASLAGRVVGADGEPIAGLDVHVSGGGVTPARSTITDDAGRFRVARLPPGARLNLEIPVDGVRPDGVRSVQREVVAGDENVELVFDRGPVIRVRFANFLRGESETRIRLLPEAGEGISRDALRPDGTAVLAGFRAGVVVRLRVGPTSLGRWAEADGIVFGAAGETVLTFRDGAATAGRLEGLAEAHRVRFVVAERDGVEVESSDDEDSAARHRFHFRNLAPGTWRVRAEATGPGSEETFEGVADVEAGDLDAVVRLVRKP